MSITVRKAMVIAAGAAVLASAPAPAAAQMDPRVVLDTLVECSKIEEVMARVACYDTNIRPAVRTTAATAPRQNAAPQPRPAPAPAAPVATASAPTAPAATASVPPAATREAVAAESARSPQRPAARSDERARTSHTVTAVAERGPGAYMLTLEDGTQWEFAEDKGLSYLAPRRGSTVEIERGSLGSYRMRFDAQQPVRVRRVR
ncbi:MAG: hypothetical protein J0I69_10565 [Altererythrobacter sp.]|nr:hypothetical protein [Altererythrobacter sp.]OJU59788.1 MAG: hypothetical protein BGO08_09325 [Altererythrobacter sp. 66-12]